MTQLNDKIALVTGGGTGIGRAIAHVFADAGATVLISGRREAMLHEAAAAIGGDVRPLPLDVSDRAAVRETMEALLDEFERVDILVNNAGINVPDRGLDVLKQDDFERIMSINVTGTFNVIHALLPAMRARGEGLIINISSVAGIRASVVAGAAYCASKYAMSALTKSITLEEAQHGIRATSIEPGAVNTPIMDDRPSPPDEAARAAMLQPDDLAAAALFVATLPPRAHVPQLVIAPTNSAFAS